MSKNGLLLPGDPSLGVVKFQGKFFVFSSEKGIQDFLANPLRYSQGNDIVNVFVWGAGCNLLDRDTVSIGPLQVCVRGV